MIAIKGMEEMPTSCKECMLNNVDSPWFDLCRTTGNNVIEYKDSRYQNCPLVEIVTCKDRKHWHDDGIMTTCDKNIGNGFLKDYYCADAERKNNEYNRN